MKGFSSQETKDYYQTSFAVPGRQSKQPKRQISRARSMTTRLSGPCWTKEFNDRTERTFTGQPVFVPTWWRATITYRPMVNSGEAAVG